MHISLAAAALAALALPGSTLPVRAPEQPIGLPLVEEVELEDFANVPATSWGQFTGRTVLVEFFAHW